MSPCQRLPSGIAGVLKPTDRDFSAELGVGGAVHLAHSARADRAGDAVVGQDLTDQGLAFSHPGSNSSLEHSFVNRAPDRLAGGITLPVYSARAPSAYDG
jgi:hypothetical protein